MRLDHELWMDSAQKELCQDEPDPSLLPPLTTCFEGRGAVYLGIQIITQFLSILLLYPWWGE